MKVQTFMCKEIVDLINEVLLGLQLQRVLGS